MIENLRRMLARDPMEIVDPILTFAITFLIGWIVRGIALRALRAWTSRSQSRGGQVMTDALKGPVLLWIVLLACHLALQSSSLPAKYTDRGAQILFVCWAVSVTLMVTRIGGSMVRLYGGQVPGALPVTTLSQNLVQIGLVILGAVWLLEYFHISITPILTALGVGGIAVALALQDTLSNLFAGFYVAVARQVRPGDYIKLNTGEEGYVADITWRTISVRTLANNLTLIPNAKLAQANVTNYYLPDKKMGVGLQINVSIAEDPERIERLLLDVALESARQIPGMVADPPPSIAFDPGYGESFLGFTVGFQIEEFAQQFSVKNELRKRISQRLRSEGVEFAVPARLVRWDGAAVPVPTDQRSHT